MSSTTAGAGPSGTAPPPPAWLATRPLPCLTVSAGTPLFRVHRAIHQPIFFGPAIDPATGFRQPPTYRFDSLTGAFGVLYVGGSFEGAFAETVLRNPQRRLVSLNYVTLRAVSELTASRDLKLVDFVGAGLSTVGLTNAISTGPYMPCWTWSDYLWSHRDRRDGIAYLSRHDPVRTCYAIFERTDVTFHAALATHFSTLLPDIRRFLLNYGKILTRP